MRTPKSFEEFADRGPLLVLAVLMLVTLPVTAPLGLVARCIVDGLCHGWNWLDRWPGDDGDGEAPS